MRNLPLEIHVAVEQFDSSEARALPVRVPRHSDVVIWRDVKTVEAVSVCVKHSALGIGRNFINKNEAAIAGEYEVVSVKADVGLAVAADSRVLAESVNDRRRVRSDVIRL